MRWRPFAPERLPSLQALLDPSRPGLSQEKRRQGDDDRRQIYWQPTAVTLRQQINDAVTRQIDQDRAIAMAPPPRPFVDPDGLQRRGVRHGGRPHQPEQGGWTGGEL
jgi:hypothetical protein